MIFSFVIPNSLYIRNMALNFVAQSKICGSSNLLSCGV